MREVFINLAKNYKTIHPKRNRSVLGDSLDFLIKGFGVVVSFLVGIKCLVDCINSIKNSKR